MNINLFVPTFAIEDCLSEIRECLEKGWTGLGYKTVAFEDAWKSYTGLPNAHFLNSATSGLHLAVNIYKDVDGWSDGDEVITTPLTFVSTNHAILYERLTPVFADVDEYLCLDPADVERKITKRTRAVIFVGIGGNTGQFEKIKEICRARGLRLILDAAHMAGTHLHGKTPTCDVEVFSFQAVKTLPTADSGMICFANPDHDAIARKKSWLGINKDTYTRTTEDGTYRWQYDVEYVGFKYHGNSIMAAIGLAQLKRLEADVAYRRQLCTWYDELLGTEARVTSVPMAPGCRSARHLYQILVESRDKVMVSLNEMGIFPGVHYLDNRAYRMYKADEDTCPNSTRVSRLMLSLPLHLRLSRADVEIVADGVRAAINAARDH